MKVTIELRANLLREAILTAERDGISLGQLIKEAVSDRVMARRMQTIAGGAGWSTPRADVPSDEIWRIQALIDEEFEADA